MNILGQIRNVDGVLDWEHAYDEGREGEQSRKRWCRRVHRREAIPTNSALHCPLERPAVAATCVPPMVDLTRHAAHRMKNRGISMDQVLLLTDFGRPQRVHGATRYALDRRTRDLLLNSLPLAELRCLKMLNIVAVISDEGTLITAAHRTSRLRRKVLNH